MKKSYKILLIIIVVLVIIRLILPYVVLHFANDRLAKVKGYYGHIQDIDLSLFRGAYTINDIYLNKQDTVTKKQTDFFRAEVIDLSVEWAALLHGGIKGELVFESPVLIFTKDKVELAEVGKDTTDFRKLLKDFMPLEINRFEVIGGQLQYLDLTSKPKVDVSLTDTHILALNLTNLTNQGVELPSSVTAHAGLYEGSLDFNMRLNALAKQPTFDLNAQIQNTNLVLLNDFLKAYGNFDVHKGSFGLYTEMSAAKGKFKGYVKPIIKNLDVVGVEDTTDTFFQKLWESVVGGVGVIFKNHKKDQVATKVPIEGKFKDPKIGTLDAVWEVVKNAFIQALMPSIDNEINLHSVKAEEVKEDKNLLQRIFSDNKEENKDKDKKEKKEKRKKEKENK